MKVILIRHGKTLGNEKKQYIGRTDELLADRGKQELRTFQLRGCYPPVDAVYASPMIRCKESIKILYPGHLWKVIADLAECDFGEFEQKTYEELKQDRRYKDWLNGIIAPPGGEGLTAFKKRVLQGFDGILREAVKKNQDSIAVILHGGSIMAIMEEYAQEAGSFYQYHVENGNGFQMTIRENSEGRDQKVTEIKKLWGE